MAHINESIIIARPVEDVFAFAGDYRNDPKWRAGVTTMTVSPDEEISVGSRTKEVLRFAGKVYITQANVVVWKPNQHTAFKSVGAPNPVEGARRFEDTDAGTRLTYTLTITPQSIIDKMMMPVLAMMFSSQVRKDLLKLKAQLERN